MGRYARQVVADIPYHVINRGNNRQPIFFADEDYLFFMDSLELAKEKYPCRIYSFVLMTNHMHLLLMPLGESENLAYFMKNITQRYGQYINKQYKRSGTLWEGRFKSSPVSTDGYLLACSRYIEMNPVRAAMVEKPGDYRFSSYNSRSGGKEIRWLDDDPVYLGMGATSEDRQRSYRNWFKGSIPKSEWKLIREAVQHNWAYGNDRFKGDMEMALGRKFEVRRAGRKAKI